MAILDNYQPGTVLNQRYEIVKLLGKGGRSKVYLARDQQLDGALRALKQMTVPYVDYDQYIKAMADFNREAEVLSRLEHPTIPSLHDFFLANGDFILIMQYIEGKTLEQVLAQSPSGWLDEKQVTEWAIQLCDTLTYIHSLNPPMVYRDLKPANIIINEQLHQIFLIDFGIARFIKNTISTVTAVGTFGYAPPELYFGTVGPASDIYSLGATMYHLLTGTVPQFKQGDPEFNLRTLPTKVNSNISSEMERILVKALAGRPDQRFESAKDMELALDIHLDRLVNEISIPVEMDATLQYPPRDWGASKKKKKKAQAEGRIKVYTKKKKIGEYYIDQENFTIGREDLNQGVVPDLDLTLLNRSGKISRRHARIIKSDDKYYFEDVGSANGSLLNGEKLKAHERRLLRSGDRIHVGDVIIEFLTEKSTDQIG